MGMRNAVKCEARGGMTKGEVVTAVFERDKYQCTKCGKPNSEHKADTGRALDVHRNEPGSYYRLDICILLCRKCHAHEPKLPRGVEDAEGKRQFNCQPDHETWARMAAMKDRVAVALNLVKVSDAVLLRLAMAALEKEFPAESKRRGKA